MLKKFSFVIIILIPLLTTIDSAKSLSADMEQNSTDVSFGTVNSSFAYLRELPTPNNPRGSAIEKIPKGTVVKIIEIKNMTGKNQPRLYFVKGFYKEAEYNGWVHDVDIDLDPGVKLQYNDNVLQNCLNKITINMSKDEVSDILGNPNTVSKFNERNYVYYYDKSDGSIPISFENGQVASIGADLNKIWKITKGARKVALSKEEELLQNVIKIPKNNIHDNYKIYSQLYNLDPDNDYYKRKMYFYLEKSKELNKKKEKTQKHAQKLSDQKRKELVSKGFILELLNWHWGSEHGYVTAQGQVRNISGRKLERVQALATWYDKNGDMITSEDAIIEYDPILPEQKSPFKVMKRYNPAMESATIEFKFMRGKKIPTFYDKE